MKNKFIFVAVCVIVGIILLLISQSGILNKNNIQMSKKINNELSSYTSKTLNFTLNYQTDSRLYDSETVKDKNTKEPYEYLFHLTSNSLYKKNADDGKYFNFEIYNKSSNSCDTDSKLKANKNLKNLTIKDINVAGISTKLVNYIGAENLDYSRICFSKDNLIYSLSSTGSTKTEFKSIRDKYFMEVVNSFKFTK